MRSSGVSKQDSPASGWVVSSQDTAYPVTLRLTMRQFPEVTAMAHFGTVSEMAMRIVLIGWFKD